MRIDKHKNDCCGCTLCSEICPKDAIRMKPDVMGFLYPEVDDSRCIDCGLCAKYCAFTPTYKTEKNLPQPIAYGGKHKDPANIAKSQSGAAFVALSDYILSSGGVVYGAGYGEHFRVVHKRATNESGRDEFRGSKYVQSDMTGVYASIREDLDNERIVMFTGTPCQTAAVSSCFARHKLRQNLYLMDIVCHGVPGPYMWEAYLQFLEKKQGEKLTKVNFRDKGYKGWHSHVESFTFAHSHTYTYTYLFYSHINLRYSCANCPYTNLRRTSDVTVADFWGIEKSQAAHLGEDNKGCSLFLLNTPKGVEWFGKIKENLLCQEVRLDECMQPQLMHPAELHKKRDQFEADYAKYGFAYVRRKYGNVGINRIENAIKKILRPVIKKYKR